MGHLHSVYDTDAHLKINGITRVITNASDGKTVLVQGDHNSERFSFEVPRMVDGHDLSECNVTQIHYINIDSSNKSNTSVGVYEVDDLKISPDSNDVVILSWLISGNATVYAGSLNFLVKFKCVDSYGNVAYVWNTAIYTGISISSGIDNGYDVVEEYSDVLEQWRQELIDAGGISDDRIERVVTRYMVANPVEDGRGIDYIENPDGDALHVYYTDGNKDVVFLPPSEFNPGAGGGGGSDSSQNGDCVKTVNGIAPDENGNVEVTTHPGSTESGGLEVAGTPKPGYFVGLTDNLVPTWMSKEGEVEHTESDNLATAENTAYDGRIDHSITAMGGSIDSEILAAGSGPKHAKIEIPTGKTIIGVRYKAMGWRSNYTGAFVFTDENGIILWAGNCGIEGTGTADGWCLPANTNFGSFPGVTITIVDTGVLFNISGLVGVKYLYFTTVRYDGLVATDIGVYLDAIPGVVKKYDAWFVMGDSLSAGNRSHAETFYYEFVQNHLGKTITLNKLAVGSKNSVSVVSEQIPQIVEVEGKRNLITCMIGTNDTFETEDAFKTNIESIISAVQTNCPNSTLVMITNPPRFDSEDYAAKMLTNANTIKEVCAEKNVKCIDFYHECGFAEANLAYFFCSDNLHLTAEGQRILATLLEPFVHSFFTI